MSDTENIHDFNQSQIEKEDNDRFFKINDALNNISYEIDTLRDEYMTPFEIINDIINYRISSLTNKISYHLEHNEKDKIRSILSEIQRYNRIKNML